MLKIFDKDHNAIGHIVKYKDCRIESEVATGDKTLSFTYLAGYHSLQNEMYIQTRTDEYVIKEVLKTSDGFPKIVAILNLEDLRKDMWQSYSVTDATINEAAMTVLAGTGWTIGECTVVKRRNAGMIQVSSLDVIQNLCTAFMCEPVFDTIKKKVSFYAQRGQDKGVYFLQGLNLKKLKKNQTSYDYYTRIIPIGQDGLTIESVNGGQNYLENYQYSEKILTYIWKDESYTDPLALMEDAELKLEDMSKPETTYKAEVRDLACQNNIYSILSYGLGDTVTIIDQNTGTREKQRIKKLVEYPQEPNKNTCEIANTVLTFEVLQQKYKAAADIINYTVTGDGRYTGTIKVSDILNFESGLAGSSTVGNINSSITGMQGEIGKLSYSVGEFETNYLKAEVADIKYATIESLNVVDLHVKNLVADYAEFKSVTADEIAANTAIINTLKADVGYVDELIFGSASGTSIHTSFSNAVIAQLGNAQIKSAMIESVSADKITAGDIITNNVRVMSEDGKLLISDETIQISDATRVRVQIGKDALGDYSINIWDESGNLMFSKGGITDSAIKEAIIRNDMVSDNANISAKKLDIDTLFTVLNEDGSHTLKSSKILLDEKNQTLDMAFTAMTTVIDDLSAAQTTQGTAITTLQGQISSKIWQQDITTAIDDLEIGGRNLLLDSGIEVSNNEYVVRDYIPSSPLVVGEEYTISVCITPALGVTHLRIYVSNGYYGLIKLDVNSTDKQILTGSFICGYADGRTPDDNIKYANINICRFPNNGTVTDNTTIHWIKIEKGNIVTDWTPAPEDMEGEITSLSTQYSDLSQAVSEITATVAKHTTDISNKADNSTVTTVSNQVTALELSLDGFKTTVSDTYTTKTEFNNLEIGGRNLLKNTAFLNGTKNWTNRNLGTFQVVTANSVTYLHAVSTAVGSTDHRFFQGTSHYNHVAGEEYTLSFKAKSSANNTIFTSSVAGAYNMKEYVLSTDWVRYVHTYTAENTGGTSFWLNHPNTDVDITEIKLEKGNKSTDWSPAPEDVETTISTVKETIIQQTDEAISLKASMSEVTDLIAASEASFELTAEAIRSEVSNVEGRVTTVEQTTSGLTARVDTVESTASDAAKTATNYLNFSQNGLCIGDHTAGTLGRNVLIDSDSVEIRNGKTVLARYGDDYIDLGINNGGEYTAIRLCDGIFKISANEDPSEISIINLSTEGLMFIGANRQLRMSSDTIVNNYELTSDISCNGLNMDSNGVPYSLIRLDARRYNTSTKREDIAYLSIANDGVQLGIGEASANSDRDAYILFNENGSVTIYAQGKFTSFENGNISHNGGIIVDTISVTGNAAVSGTIFEGGTALSGKYLQYTIASSHPGIVVPSGYYWIRTPTSGIIPYASDGANGYGYIGSEGWEFKGIYANRFYAQSTAAVDVGLTASNSNIRVGLYAGASGYAGIYNSNKASWAVYYDTVGSIYLGAKMIVPISGNAGIRPNGDNTYNAGNADNRFMKVFAATGTIQTSDEREKDILTDNILEKYSSLFMDIKPIAYRWKYSQDKQIHLGIGAQTFEQQLKEHGFDSSLYGFIEYDELEEPTSTGQTDRYGMNYQNLQMLTLMQAQKNTRELESLGIWKETVDIDFGIYQSKQEQLEMRIEHLQEQLIEANQKIAEQEAEINQLKAIYAA